MRSPRCLLHYVSHDQLQELKVQQREQRLQEREERRQQGAGAVERIRSKILKGGNTGAGDCEGRAEADGDAETRRQLSELHGMGSHLQKRPLELDTRPVDDGDLSDVPSTLWYSDEE